jgi:hypothetical protein
MLSLWRKPLGETIFQKNWVTLYPSPPDYFVLDPSSTTQLRSTTPVHFTRITVLCLKFCLSRSVVIFDLILAKEFLNRGEDGLWKLASSQEARSPLFDNLDPGSLYEDDVNACFDEYNS